MKNVWMLFDGAMTTPRQPRAIATQQSAVSALSR
jgi:hypothetical protein